MKSHDDDNNVSGIPVSRASLRPVNAQGGLSVGRGRAKAKQTRVARELKYSSPNTDYAALQHELGASGTASPVSVSKDEDDDDRWLPATER